MAWIRPRKRKDGTAYFSVYWREEGRSGKQSCLSWNDYADAEHCQQLIEKVGADKAREILRIVQSPRQEQTVTQYLTHHIDQLTGIEKGTIARYRSYVTNDFGPAFGDIPIASLTSVEIARWVNDSVEDGASGKTIKNKRDFLSGALKAGVAAGKLKSNPCESVKAPRTVGESTCFLERDEFQLLLGEVTDYWKPLVEFLVASGCRWSEATALKPSAVDVKAGTVRITTAWKTGGGGYTLGTTKSTKSMRTINVPTRILKQLDLTGEWVFTNSGRGQGQFADKVIRPSADPVRIHSFHPNVWVPAVKRAGEKGLTKKPRIHDLRHTCASWLVAAGRPLPAVQAQLGHENITTTVGTYGHLDRSSGKGNADAIDAMLS